MFPKLSNAKEHVEMQPNFSLPMNKVKGSADAFDVLNICLFNQLLVAFINTAVELLKLKSCMALATDTTTGIAGTAAAEADAPVMGFFACWSMVAGGRITGAPSQ